MRYAYFAAGKAVFAFAAPFAVVALAAGVVTMGALYVSHCMDLRAERWGR